MKKYEKQLPNKHMFTVKTELPRAGHDYFAVTAEERSSDRRLHDPVVACGCMHDEVLHHWPELADVVALHLSDVNGVPMHAGSNGWYWLAGACGGLEERYHGGAILTALKCREILAEHLRISPSKVGELISIAETIMKQEGAKAARDNFGRFVDEQLPRWREEALAVIAKYKE